MKKSSVLAVMMCVMAVANFASADTIRGINIDFVTIGNANNAADTQVMQTDGTTGYGEVGYNYRIGKYEVTNAQWDSFAAAAGAPASGASPTGAQQPIVRINWYEASQFCNYLTSGDKSKGVYQLGIDGSITVDRTAAISVYGTAYVFPTENEWYKAAYYKPDSSGYSLYANGQNTIPAADNGWNFEGGLYNAPWNIGSGGIAEQNGTYDMMGNVWEWTETLMYTNYYIRRGGSSNDGLLDSSASFFRIGFNQDAEIYDVGFRIASVPEPATLLLLGLGTVILRKKRKA